MPSSIVIVIVSMIRVRPVWMTMGHCFVFVPMAVVCGVRHSREQVIVMAHLPVMVLEGVVVAFCLAFLMKVKPELLGATHAAG